MTNLEAFKHEYPRMPSNGERNALSDAEPNLSDIPEITEEIMQKGKFVNFKRKKRCGTLSDDHKEEPDVTRQKDSQPI